MTNRLHSSRQQKNGVRHLWGQFLQQLSSTDHGQFWSTCNHAAHYSNVWAIHNQYCRGPYPWKYIHIFYCFHRSNILARQEEELLGYKIFGQHFSTSHASRVRSCDSSTLIRCTPILIWSFSKESAKWSILI